MLAEETRVATQRASRYLVQLCEHLDQLTGRSRSHAFARRHGGGAPAILNVEWSAERGVVRFERATFILASAPDALMLRVEAEDVESLERIKRALSKRIEAIGRRDGLAISW